MRQHQEITTPRGKIFVTPQGKAELVWNPNFREKWGKRYSKAQVFLDSEILRLCDPFTPFRTGMLIKSGILGTDVGSGLVKWIAPYSRYQYYLVRKGSKPGEVKVGTETGPLRGPYWFHRMKQVFGRRLIKQVKKIIGRGES